MQQAYPLAARAAHIRRWALAAAALLLAVLLPGGAQATVYYVDVTRADNSGDGLGWGTAKKDVQAAINLATAAGDEVWVKAGTYLPTLVPPTTTPTTARDQAFYLLDTDIKLYGGFAGGENVASQRNPLTNPTTLSGDLDGSLGTVDAYHVLLTVGRTSTCVVDGFTLQGGRANGTGSIGVQPTTGAAVSFTRTVGGGLYNNTSSPTVSSCTFSTNTASGQGAGLYNITSSPTVSSCTFSTNTASTGGGMYNSTSSPTVSSCIFSNNTGNNGGGGMYNITSSPTVSSCTFSANKTNSSGQGGGMTNSTSSSPTVSNCTFSGNTATVSGNGGGMSNSISSSPMVSNCTFSGNTSGAGGGLHSNNSSPTVSSCTFSSNTGNNGGGMYNTGTGSPTVSNCTFSGHTSSIGGGLFNNSTGTGSPTVSSCTFSNNTATGPVGFGGGGIFNNAGSLILSNCTFSANTATGAGGGGGLYIVAGSPTVSSCTFSANSATSTAGLGGGVYCAANGGGSLTNCIFYRNTTPNNGTDANREEIYKAGTTAVLTVSYCIVRDAAGTAPSLTVFNAALSNCFTTDPGYVDATDADGPDDTWRTADDGLRLACGSFAVDKGTGTSQATDILGNPRKGLLDLGAYEATGGTAPADAIPTATTTVSGVQTAAALPYTDCQNQLLLLDATTPYTLLGSTIATVRVLPTAPLLRTQPYVRRTYDIAPLANAATATAEVTLYFTQADFDDYNTARGSRPALPTTPADVDGYAANLRITQKHGSSATGAPDSYTGWAGSGPATVLITPTAVTYNATAARWEVRFPVTGFSGFFAHTGSVPLPVELREFTATPAGLAAVRLAWATASEQHSAAFEVERSLDGTRFERIGTVAAAGSSSAPRNYGFEDTKMPTHPATLYYRLRQVDLDGSAANSPVRTVSFTHLLPYNLTLFPNPAHGAATLTGALPGTTVTVLDALGRPVTSATADASGTAALVLPAGLPAGVYVVRAGSRAVRLTVE